MPTELIRLEDIAESDHLNSRAEIDEATVDDYAQDWRNGDRFPPVVIYRTPDGRNLLSEGFHRTKGAQRAGLIAIPAEIREGTERDALLNSCVSNLANSLRRSGADKRHAVKLLLSDEEWRARSNALIARHLKVSAPLVADVRAELTQSGLGSPTRRIGADGRVIEVGNLGRRPESPSGEIETTDSEVPDSHPDADGSPEGVIATGGRVVAARAKMAPEAFVDWLAEKALTTWGGRPYRHSLAEHRLTCERIVRNPLPAKIDHIVGAYDRHAEDVYDEIEEHGLAAVCGRQAA